MTKILRGLTVAFVSASALLGTAAAASATAVPSRTVAAETAAVHSVAPAEAGASWVPAGVFTKRNTCRTVGKLYVQQGKATDYKCITIPLKKRSVTVLWIRTP